MERPVTFIPAASISSVEFLRAGGGSATFDFYVHTKVTGANATAEILPLESASTAAVKMTPCMICIQLLHEEFTELTTNILQLLG